MLQVTGLTKYYGKVCGVHDLNFEIAAGEIFGLVGPDVDLENITLLVDSFIRLFRQDRPLDDVMGVLHAYTSSTLSLAATVITSLSAFRMS